MAPSPDPSPMNMTEPVAARTLIKRALEVKDELTRPNGSQFRVICGIEYKYVSNENSGANESSSTGYETIFGSNIETVTLCGGVCAERS